MGAPVPVSPLRQVLEGQLSQLSSEVERLFDEARGRARRELADQLNLSVRRIRQSPSLDELEATLLDAAIAFAAGAAIFRIDGNAVHGEKIRGIPAEPAEAFTALRIPLATAPALFRRGRQPRSRDRGDQPRRIISRNNCTDGSPGRWPGPHLSAGGQGCRTGSTLLLGRHTRRRARNARAGGRRRVGFSDCAGSAGSGTGCARADAIGDHRAGGAGTSARGRARALHLGRAPARGPGDSSPGAAIRARADCRDAAGGSRRGAIRPHFNGTSTEHYARA